MVNHVWYKMAQDFMPFATENFPKKCQLTIIDRDIFWSLLGQKEAKLTTTLVIVPDVIAK